MLFYIVCELFGYNLYKSEKKMLDFFILPGFQEIYKKIAGFFQFGPGLETTRAYV